MEIKVALTNLGAYNEGELRFTWLDLPADGDTLQEALQDIGIDGERYEEYFISDYEAPFSIGEYDSIDKLNEMAERLKDVELPDRGYGYDAADVINFANDLCNENIVPNADEYIQDIVDADFADEMVAQQAKDGGLARVAYLIGGIEYKNEEYFYINGYGNLENVTSELLDNIVDDLLNEVKRCMHFGIDVGFRYRPSADKFEMIG